MARTAKTHRLTALALKKYAEDEATTAPLHDGGGLYLRKRDASLHWVLRLTNPATGAQQWHRLFPDDPMGVYPHKSLADARAEAKRLWATRSGGVDPRAERRRRIEGEREAREEARMAAERRVTVRKLFDRWAAIDLAPRTSTDGRRLGRKDGGAYARAQFERRVFPKIGDMAVEDVKRGALIDLLDTVKAEGKLRTANVLLTDLKQMFRFALTRDLVLRNPLDTVSKRDVGGTHFERDRVLTVDDLRMLDTVLPASGLQPRFACAVWIIVATGVRVGELLGAAWADTHRKPAELKPAADKSDVKLGYVDLVRKSWHLPETKNQRDHTIHLSAFALAQFRKLYELREAEPRNSSKAVAWVFPNTALTGPVGSKSLGKQLSDRQREPSRRLQGRTKDTSALVLPGGRWTAHDLRRTAARQGARRWAFDSGSTRSAMARPRAAGTRPGPQRPGRRCRTCTSHGSIGPDVAGQRHLAWRHCDDSNKTGREKNLNPNDNDDSRSVALYWDFENLHAGLMEAKYGEGAYAKKDNRFKVQEPLIDGQALVELGASFGPVAINRAYGNWQYFGRYRDALLQSAVELIQLFPPGASAKNGADIKLCLDATEDISRFARIGTVIGGDSDFMPVAQEIKAAGRTLIGIGNRRNTNKHWAKSCHEFRYYDSLVEAPSTDEAPKPSEAKDTPPPPPVDPAAEMLKRAVRLLAETKGEAWVHKASIWPMIKRLDPTFDTKDHGHASFAEMLKALDAVIEIKKGEKDHLVRLR